MQFVLGVIMMVSGGCAEGVWKYIFEHKTFLNPNFIEPKYSWPHNLLETKIIELKIVLDQIFF